jgi:hypothetical protein
MATRSTIAIEYANGVVDQVYCHWDGYLSNNGRILLESYSDPLKLQQLIDLGDLSVLEADIGTKHDFDARDQGCTFYGRDRGEQRPKARRYWNFEMYRLSGQREEYNYILRQVNGQAQWFVSMGDSNNFFALTKESIQRDGE